MASPFYPEVVRWVLPANVLPLSFDEMSRDGRQGNEGIALWLGKLNGTDAHVSHVLVLRGPGVFKSPVQIRIEPWLMNEVADVSIALDVSLLGQIHTHKKLWVDLSLTDLTYGVRVPSYLSVVAPEFALRPKIRIEECGVHVYGATDGFRRLPVPEVLERIHIASAASAELAVAGED